MIWAGIAACAQDYFSAAHTDPDFFMSLFTTYVNNGEDVSLSSSHT
jgi:hypothetical protein